jgi:hypothetical protein
MAGCRADLARATLYHSVRTIAASPYVVWRRELEADLVVVATGINSQTPLAPDWGYRPPARKWPRMRSSCRQTSRTTAYIFFKPNELIFGGIIPKGQYANISLLGHDRHAMPLLYFESAKLAGGGQDMPTLCGCTPRRFTAAAGYYADRMVAVGDSAVTRLYKDGLGAALQRLTPPAPPSSGHCKQDFAAGIALCRQIAIDNLYGKLFRFWSLSRRLPFLRDAWQHALIQEEQLPAGQQIHRRALWGLFTGDESYRQIFKLLLSRPALWRMGQSMVGRRK